MSRGERLRGLLAPAALAALLLWLVGYPLLITLLGAFSDSGRPFLEFARRPDEWLALGRSLWISLASVVLAALCGVPLAFLFERTAFPGRRLLATLVALPVALPPLVGVVAFLFLYGESGFAARAFQAATGTSAAPWSFQGPLAILLVHTYSFYVYFFLFTRAALMRRDPALAEAAASLGAGPWRTLWRVTLPALKPALVGAALLVFMASLASYSAPYLFGGNFRVMTTQITSSKLNGYEDAARVETVVLALVALVALWLFGRLGATRPGGTGVRGVAPRRVRGGARVLAFGVAFLVATLALLPHATLLLLSFVPPGTWNAETLPPVLSLGNYERMFSDWSRLRPVVNSLWMAAASASAAVVLGFAAARTAQRLTRSPGRSARALGRGLEHLVALPWAIPGTVFAVALAVAMSVDRPELLRFVLVGTPFLLPLAYLVRSLPLTGRSAMAGLAELDPALEEAAASLGASRATTLRRVVLPLVRPALAAGAGLAFITGLGDFVTSIVLYTLDNRPIAMAIVSELRLQELGLAATYGVLLAAVGSAAFLLAGDEAAGA